MNRNPSLAEPWERPIGIFDSGVGGLTIVRAVQKALAHEDIIYVADTAHVPYGQKSTQAIQQRARAITRFLLERQAKAIVVACNTATAAAIDRLRGEFELPFIGVEPAVKPAAAATRSGIVGVLATPATLESKRFGGLLTRFGIGVRIIAQPCAGLAEHIERGDLDSEHTEALLRGFVEPLLAAGADSIVLGCTHYPLVAHLVRRIAGPGVAVFENGIAVARELSRQLEVRDLRRKGGNGQRTVWVSGSVDDMRRLMVRLGEPDCPAESLPADVC